MANSVPVITPGSITQIGGLASRPVFFLHLNGAGQPTLVVKGEERKEIPDHEAEISISWSSKLMKNVNNRLVNTKIMTAAEIQVFLAAAQATFADGTRQRDNAGLNRRWVKMPYVPGLSDAELYRDRQVCPALLRRALQHFVREDVWHELGKVVAVDLFNGNNDRFMVQNAGVGPVDVSWANYGNIMFLDGGNTAVIGLDTWDPSGVDGFGRSNLATGAGDPTPLTILRDEPGRGGFARQCTDAVANEIGRRMRGAGVQNLAVRLNAADPGEAQIVRVGDGDEGLREVIGAFAEVFDQGLVEGRDALRDYLLGKIGQYNQENRQLLGQAPPAAGGGGWVRAAPRVAGQWNAAQPRVGAGQAAQAPLLGGGRNRPAGWRELPEGVRERMRFLGWA